MDKIFRFWFLSLVFTSLVAGFVFVVAQQSYRHSADDPQIALARDLAGSLSHGHSFTSSKSVDLAKTQSPFTIVYNASGAILTSEVQLHNQNPQLPSGVLTNAKEHGESRLTWQPEADIRIAAIIEHVANGYVLVGRSLLEVEKRELQLEQGVFLFWIVTNICMLAAITAVMDKGGKKS